jgi:hypothetical protein
MSLETLQAVIKLLMLYIRYDHQERISAEEAMGLPYFGLVRSNSRSARK